MSSASFDANLVMETVATATQEFLPRPTETDATLGPRIIPTPLRQWLARLRLLENVPFAYVVPDSLMLPPESIRFFQIDDFWLDCLLDGAFSIGQTTTHSDVVEQLQQSLLTASLPDLGRLSGVLLRSEVVSGWPAVPSPVT